MKTRICRAALVCLLLASGPAGEAAPQTAKDLFASASAREQALRADKSATAADYRAVIASYDAVVRKFPVSGYVDNALWQAATLAAEAFDRFHDERDRTAARHLFTWLADQYPGSPFVTKARESARKLDAGTGAATPPTVAAAGPPPPKPAHKTSVLSGIQRTSMADRVRVTMEFDSATAYRSEPLDHPRRLVFDLADARLGEGLAEGTLSYDEDIVRRVRIGLHPNQVVRVVIDLDEISRYTITALDRPSRIQVDCERPAHDMANRAHAAGATTPDPGRADTRATDTKATAPVPPVRPAPAAVTSPAAAGPIFGARAIEPSWALARVIHGIDSSTLAAAAASSPAPAEKPASASAPRSGPPAPPASSREAASSSKASPPAPLAPAPVSPRGTYSLARQLGLGAAKIVIDPGHGGHDPGALGTGVSESDIVLDVSLRLESLLQAAGLDVVLTRRSDEFVPLEERPQIAMREHADLFVSIHANASRDRTARGIETYFLNLTNDPYAEAVAARENAANGRTMSNLPEFVKAITLNNKVEESRSFAGLIQRTMAAQLSNPGSPVVDHGVKHAPFVVLIGASMPSILVEISFITNPQEGKLLATPAYRQRIADALFDGIRGYQKSLKNVQAGPRQ